MRIVRSALSFIYSPTEILLTAVTADARALFERVIPNFPAERARPLWERWARYEYQYGDLEASLKLEKRMAEVYASGTYLSIPVKSKKMISNTLPKILLSSDWRSGICISELMLSPIVTWASPLLAVRRTVRLAERKLPRHCFRVLNRLLPQHPPRVMALVPAAVVVVNRSVVLPLSIENERKGVVEIILLDTRGRDLLRLRQREPRIGRESRDGMARRRGEDSRLRLRLHGRERRGVDQDEEGSRCRLRECRSEKRRSRDRARFRRFCRGLSGSCRHRRLSMVTF